MIARGVLYHHPARPGWGQGLLVGRLDGRKARLSWTDGKTRTILDPERHLALVEGEAVAAAASGPTAPAGAPKPKRASLARDWSEATSERLRDLFAQGLDDKAIGRELGRSTAAVRNRRWLIGLARGVARIPADEAARILELRAQGLGSKRIARELGRSPTGVEGVLRRAGVEPRLSTRVVWTADDDDRLAALVRSGASDQHVAETLGRTVAATTHRRIHVAGLARFRRPPWSDEDNASLARLVAAGAGPTEIAARLGRTASAVRGQRDRLGLRGGDS